jgi:CheY-like chemotaxis protein
MRFNVQDDRRCHHIPEWRRGLTINLTQETAKLQAGTSVQGDIFTRDAPGLYEDARRFIISRSSRCKLQRFRFGSGWRLENRESSSIAVTAREECSMSGKKIVVIDDDPEICDALSEILGQAGYQVFTALDTKTGYTMFVDIGPDLLILDIMMATMDEGLEFATMIRKGQGIKGVPILIVSARPPVEKGYGRTLDDDLDWIHADIFMEKPIEPHELIHNVRILIKD